MALRKHPRHVLGKPKEFPRMPTKRRFLYGFGYLGIDRTCKAIRKRHPLSRSLVCPDRRRVVADSFLVMAAISSEDEAKIYQHPRTAQRSHCHSTCARYQLLFVVRGRIYFPYVLFTLSLIAAFLIPFNRIRYPKKKFPLVEQVQLYPQRCLGLGDDLLHYLHLFHSATAFQRIGSQRKLVGEHCVHQQ